MAEITKEMAECIKENIELTSKLKVIKILADIAKNSKSLELMKVNLFDIATCADLDINRPKT